MKTLYLMQGIPGSGKTTIAKIIADREEAIIFSTDDFWIHHDETGLHYHFDPTRLGEAHRWNQQRTAKEMASLDGGNIVIDNTNIKKRDVQPYVTLARIFEYEIVVMRVDVPLATALVRNDRRPVDRKVPAEIIERMHNTMEDLL